jgi:hypothetical protein
VVHTGLDVGPEDGLLLTVGAALAGAFETGALETGAALAGAFVVGFALVGFNVVGFAVDGLADVVIGLDVTGALCTNGNNMTLI